MLDAVEDSRRRELLVSLLERDPGAAPLVLLPDADRDAAAVERLVTVDRTHVPRLAVYGFIDWDLETHQVTRGPNFEAIRPLLELLVDHADELPADWP
jgi:hypothetical protein